MTHDVREALLLGTRIGLMHRGQLLLVEGPDRFLASDNPQARAYLDTLTLGPEASRRHGTEPGEKRESAGETSAVPGEPR